MHIPILFLLIIKILFFFKTSSTLRSIPTNQPQHILLKNNDCHHSITYPSYFFTQLLLHHNSHTTNSISFSRPPQIISPSFHPQHPSTQPSPYHLLQTTHFNHPLSQFFTNFFPLPLRLPNSMSQPAHKVSHHTASYTCMLQDAGLKTPFRCYAGATHPNHRANWRPQ